jgi:hypothetical protein
MQLVLQDYLLKNDWKDWAPEKGWRTPEVLPKGAHCDFLPIDTDRIWMILLLDKTLYAWEGTLDFTDKRLVVPGRFRPTFTCPAEVTDNVDFRGGFTLYGNRNTVLFVTYQGTVYAWTDPGKATQEVRLLWRDRADPVQTILVDLSTNRVWAFTRGSADSNGARSGSFFELGRGNPTAAAYKFRPEADGAMPIALRKLVPYYRVLKHADKGGEGR